MRRRAAVCVMIAASIGSLPLAEPLEGSAAPGTDVVAAAPSALAPRVATSGTETSRPEAYVHRFWSLDRVRGEALPSAAAHRTGSPYAGRVVFVTGRGSFEWNPGPGSLGVNRRQDDEWEPPAGGLLRPYDDDLQYLPGFSDSTFFAGSGAGGLCR